MGLLKKIAEYFAGPDEACQPRELGRNDDCWCGSGKKYKKCHLDDDRKRPREKYPLSCGKT